jgi:hypothetical protein
MVGARDFAILTLLARLGLRAVEVSRLELGDLHWRGGEIEVDGKGHQRGRLPLPTDVEEAVVDYLTLRGRRDSSRVFLTVRAPTRPIEPSGVRSVVRDACQRGVSWVTAPKRRALQLLIRVRGGLVVGYLDGDGLVWATPGLPTDASATAATASTFARRPLRASRP